MSDWFLWTGIAVLFIGTALSQFRKESWLGEYVYCAGLLISMIGIVTDDRASGWGKAAALTILGAIGVLFTAGPLLIERHASKCKICQERNGHAEQAVDEGQVDGRLPEEEEGGADDQ